LIQGLTQELNISAKWIKMTATTRLVKLGVTSPKKATAKKLDVAIAIKKFLVFGGPSEHLKCGKYFDFAFAEVVKIANRLRVYSGASIQLDYNELTNELTATRGSQVFTITK